MSQSTYLYDAQDTTDAAGS